MKHRMTRAAVLTVGVLAAGSPEASDFDHRYPAYGEVLARYVRVPSVDYAALAADRSRLDAALAVFDSPAARGEAGWSREQRMAFWINAYNAFTLRAIIDHYPIRGGWFGRGPRNSIRRIAGVWTVLTWQAAGRGVTLDDIEHRILRPTFKDARIHFAVNCASISCPPLAAAAYRPDTLDAQLDHAAREYLAGSQGLRVDRDTVRVSSLFKWYGEDFIAEYAPLVAGARDSRERAILGAIAKYGPPAAAERARTGRPAIEYLEYDWSLNDTRR